MHVPNKHYTDDVSNKKHNITFEAEAEIRHQVYATTFSTVIIDYFSEKH